MEIQDNSIILFNDSYYQEEFNRIKTSNETYKGKWNWWAFFFTGFWAIFKGMWLLFILIIFTSSIIQFKFPLHPGVYLTFGVSNFVWAMIMGYRGTWFYYTLKVKKKQPPF